MTVVAKTNHENASHWYKLERVGIPMWRSVFMVQLSAFVNSLFFFFPFPFFDMSAFGVKIIIIIGKRCFKDIFGTLCHQKNTVN